ncbi:hypothetical protein [Candidatus Avelusimicrobium stercoris]|uniref:hypothetical protein n=1 Tax=Candidatus Avelusimicrobium stercoris TaxID=1947924 RepID=UPI003D0A2B7F
MMYALIGGLMAMAVGVLCVLSAAVGRAKERLRVAKQEQKENEKMDKILEQVAAVPDERLLDVLRGEHKLARKRTRLPRSL